MAGSQKETKGTHHKKTKWKGTPKGNQESLLKVTPRSRSQVGDHSLAHGPMATLKGTGQAIYLPRVGLCVSCLTNRVTPETGPRRCGVREAHFVCLSHKLNSSEQYIAHKWFSAQAAH